jgi:hypothetical protein
MTFNTPSGSLVQAAAITRKTESTSQIQNKPAL